MHISKIKVVQDLYCPRKNMKEFRNIKLVLKELLKGFFLRRSGEKIKINK